MAKKMSLFLGFRGLLRRSALAKCPDTVGRVLWGERRNKLSVAWGGGGRSTAPCKVSPVAGLVSTRCPSSTCTPCTMGMERRLRKERGFNETHSTHPTHCQHVGPDRPGGGGVGVMLIRGPRWERCIPAAWVTQAGSKVIF